jgi:hypothetical protein
LPWDLEAIEKIITKSQGFTYEFLIELISLRISIMLEIIILIPLSDFILKTLIFLGVLVLFNFWLKFFKLLLRV